MPVYDKPMIYYPLSTLMLAGIHDILIITTPHDVDNFKEVLKDGSQWGISIQYAIQPSPDGLAQAFLIGEKFIGNDTVTLVLGDNIFYGEGLSKKLQEVALQEKGTHESLLDAGLFIKVVSDRQGLKVACLEEIAFRMGLIDTRQLNKIAQSMKKNGYGQYLSGLIQRDQK